MKKMFRDSGLSIAMALGAVVLLIGVVVLITNVVPVTAQAGLVEQHNETVVEFDTSVLQTWCRGEDMGTVRMVGAWVAESVDNAHTLNDETGNAWIVEDITLHEDDWLLLWIADNHTTEDVTDDVIIKVWAEAH